MGVTKTSTPRLGRFRMKTSSSSFMMGASPLQTYDAATTGRRALPESHAGPTAAVVGSGASLVARSRKLVANNGYARSILRTLVSDIVGTGIKAQSSDPELQRLWKRWARQTKHYNQQNLVARAMLEGGDAFGRFRIRRPEDGLTVPLDIQLIEAEQLPFSKTEAYGQNRIVAGVEIGPIGYPVAYHVLRRHPGDAGLVGVDITQTSRVPARDMMHVMIPERPNQVRGVPHLTATAILLHELHGYLDSEAVRKRVVANIAGFLKRRPGDPDDPNSAMGAATEPGDEEGTAVIPWEPGTLADIGEDEIEFVQPADVGGNFDAYVKAQLHAIASSAGVLYEQLNSDYQDIGDRTYRAAILNYRREIQRLQQLVLVDRFCQPAWERFVDTAILSGAYTPPAGTEVEDLYEVTWVPQGWPYIQPEIEVDAAAKQVRNGFKSRAEVVTEQGRDPDEVDTEQAADNERAAGFGLTYETTTAAAGGSEEGSDA